MTTETFDVAGAAPNFHAAHNMAWDGLGLVLGIESVEAWSLKTIQHVFVPATQSEIGACITFQAQFVRVDVEVTA